MYRVEIFLTVRFRAFQTTCEYSLGLLSHCSEVLSLDVPLIVPKAALPGLPIRSDFFKLMLGYRCRWTDWVQYTDKYLSFECIQWNDIENVQVLDPGIDHHR